MEVGMRVVTYIALGIAATLTACATTSYQGDENSPYYVVPNGSRFTLNQSLTISPETASTYIQYGKTMGETEVMHYYPYCKFELYHRSESARTVAPDTMTVTKVESTESQDKVVRNGRVRFASASAFPDIPNVGGFDPIWLFTTRMYLRADKDPDIYRLTCARQGYYNRDTFVTISEMRRTLDPLLTLTIPGQTQSTK
jgi:hypothetical protein